MTAQIENHLRSKGALFSSMVASTFSLPADKYIKFEFLWIPNRATVIHDEADRVNGAPVRFRSSASVTLLYLKPQSVIYFETKYLFAVTSGCGNQGRLWAWGGIDHSLEEIYFNKITTVGAFHEEDTVQVVSNGCSGSEDIFAIKKDGFIIRAGENFRVIASVKYQSELAEARRNINDRISRINRG